jgi:hypothetical protein
MTLWERLELITDVNKLFAENWYRFAYDIEGRAWRVWFYLFKVNLCLWFGWEASAQQYCDLEYDEVVQGLAYFKGHSVGSWDAPPSACAWEQVNVGRGIFER